MREGGGGGVFAGHYGTSLIIYLPRESRRTTSPEYPASVQRRTFDAGRVEQASNSRT